MIGGPPASGRGGGPRLRKGNLRGVSTSQAHSNTGNQQRSSLAFANLQNGIVPNLHTDPTQTYVTYCVLERRRNAKKGPKMVWLKNTLAMLLSVDPHVKILSYDGINNANSINHMNLIPEEHEQLSIYFPRFYTNGGSLSTKCKIRSSMKIKEIKWRLMQKLQNIDYWITPSQLKATRTGKAGWFLGGHPELTHRPDFQTFLQPLIVKHFNKKIEFQVEPEMESMSVGKTRVSQRVLMTRCPLDEVQNIRALFSELFSDETEEDIGYLARYRFITTHPMGLCTRNHLQAILKSQQVFHKTIHFFIVYGIANFETNFVLNGNEKHPPPDTSPNSPHASAKASSTNVPQSDVQITQPPDPNTQDEDMESVNGKEEGESQAQPQTEFDPVSRPTASVEKEFDASTNELSQLSPRMFFYLCQSTRTHSNLFHATYPSTELNKIYVLVTQDNMEEALSILHNMDAAMLPYFSQTDLSRILVGQDGNPPYVKDFPKITRQFQSYANVLKNLAPEVDCNPQDQESEPPAVQYVTNTRSFASTVTNNIPHETPPASKRTREGDPVHPVTPHRASRLPKHFVENTQHDQLHSTVTESIARMRNLENNQSNMSKHMESYGVEISKITQTVGIYGDDISKMSNSIANNSNAIRDIRKAQEQQQSTIESLADVQNQMLQSVNSIVNFNETIIKPKLFADTPDGSRGAQS